MSELIFNKMQTGRYAHAQAPKALADCDDIPESYLRQNIGLSKGASEMDVVRHFTQLSQLNFSIDTNPYPLGSCTMKYNPRGVQISTPEFLNFHPETPAVASQGFLACLHDLQEYLKEIVGMSGISLAPMAGAHGEFVGVSMIRAYHLDRGDHHRTELLVPDAAHGTNPASAMMCGYQVREIPTKINGDIDLDALEAAIGPQTAGIMLTNPSTLGTFERDIVEVAKKVHAAGGLLYYDGANLNAILGKVRPGDMGFDVMHLNLHKTFATPHGGGGPGAGPVAVGERLAPYLPVPTVEKGADGQYCLRSEEDCPKSIGRVTAFMGNALVLIRAYLYICLLGREGVPRVAEFATLNANYLLKKLKDVGFSPAYPDRLASHEFCLTLAPELKQFNVKAMDFAKGLLDFGFHAPTVYFPLLVAECLLVEPTETESLETLDQLVSVFNILYEKAKTEPEYLRGAPWSLPVKRLDEVLAARNLDLVHKDVD